MKTLYLRSLVILLILVGMLVGLTAAVAVDQEQPIVQTASPTPIETATAAEGPMTRDSVYVTIP